MIDSTLPVQKLRFGIIVPTLNPGPGWRKWLITLKCQIFQPDHILVIDSGSLGDVVNVASQLGVLTHTIQPWEFDHGGTRQLGVSLLSHLDVLIFMTQDSLLADRDALGKLLGAFVDCRVGAVYGRQLPHVRARPIEAHARMFNYPNQSRIKQFADSAELGLKTVFISNSFAAYRREALMSVGGFPSGTIFGEDTIVAARMLLQGWKVAYCADAQVYHSHHYTFRQEFRRYFDVGVLHAREPWIQENFGGASGEGKRFVISELKYLLRKAPWLIPSALLRTVLKLVGYRLGKLEARLPVGLKKRLSMHRRFWERESARG
ncbi:glycosyltransferase family 2 protein [Thermithiobacillus plumbiphilus]|uniref:Glycosyltransferase family 2 protein n=1 Tax=Thermithiobacillus plumbiphilus TaxID=1729899 RepID=A0ABU9D7L9_9PROT